ncbi:MAG TPA: hypothetical protein VJ111_14445 [Chitinophagaceae bacterium]|nr:hypothetical protein [Chitinophagaceae bacterium]
MIRRNYSEIMIIVLAIFSVIMGCTTPKSALDNESRGNEQIPAIFDPAKRILLIEQNIENDSSSVALSTTMSVKTDDYMNYYMKKNKKSMVEYADKNYPYKHEFASQNDIYGSNSKYSDKHTYQFALVTTMVKPNQYTKVDADGRMKPTNYQPIFRFYLYDRLNGKTYSALGNGSSLIMWAFKNAIKKISEQKK